ncbi:MAG: hypothetical protein ACXVJT_11540 [Thermoanaerobaculia bacterium]
MKKFWVVMVMVVAPIAAVHAAPQPPTVRILAPTLTRSTPGAFGSIWVTEFAVVNSNTTATTLEYARSCPSECSAQISIPAGGYKDITDVLNSASAAPGVFLYVPTAAAPLMEFSLRVRNLSVQALTFGAEVPVVREDAAFTRPFSLLNVPIDARFRHLLRIYDFSGQTSTVKVEYLSIPNGSVLAVRMVPVFGESTKGPSGLSYPAFGSAQQPAEIADAERVRIRISPLDSTQKLWAFVSFTNNETQEVTNVSPQQ